MTTVAGILCISLLLNGVSVHHTHRLHHKAGRKHRALADGGELRFEPEPYSKKLELKSSGKIHCKVAGGVAPTVQWSLNDSDPLPDGVTSVNGTLLVVEASKRHAGKYTCHASDAANNITAAIQLDVVVSPRVLEPAAGAEVHAARGGRAWLACRAAGDPAPTTHWDRNSTILTTALDGVEREDGPNVATAKIVLMKNGSLLVRNVSDADADRYGCTAGSAAGLARAELTLVVHPEGELSGSWSESSGVAGKAVVVSVAVAAAYMVLVLALMVYCRRRRLQRRRRGEKLELEMAEGREKLVEEGEEKPKANGVPALNGRLAAERDSGADNSEVSAASRASKRSGHYDHLAVPRTLLTELITLGRGEFGDVMLSKIDVSQVRRLRSRDQADAEPRVRPVMVKVLSTKDEVQLAEFRRVVELFSRVRHENVARLVGLCNEAEPHYLLLEHTDWGDLKQFLSSTRSAAERAEYAARVRGACAGEARAPDGTRALPAPHAAALALQLARAARALAAARLTHRDIAARNCLITSKLQLKLSSAALTRGPSSHEYYKLHDQVIPLRWLPSEAVLEGDYSTKSDVYMFAVTVWEIYTKAELPFAKLNDNSVMERIKAGTLEWTMPPTVPEKLATLLNKCLSKSPADRPMFDTICEEISIILKSITAENTNETQEIVNNEKIEE